MMKYVLSLVAILTFGLSFAQVPPKDKEMNERIVAEKEAAIKASDKIATKDETELAVYVYVVELNEEGRISNFEPESKEIEVDSKAVYLAQEEAQKQAIKAMENTRSLTGVISSFISSGKELLSHTVLITSEGTEKHYLIFSEEIEIEE